MREFFGRYGRWVSPSAFGIVVISFALPFMGIKCADQSLVSVSAFDVAVGGVIREHLEKKTEKVDREGKGDIEFEPQNYLISVALPLFVLAGFLALWRNKPALVATLLCGVIGFFITVVYRILTSISFAAAMAPSPDIEWDFSGLVRLDWRYGFWFIVLFCGVGIAARIYYERVAGEVVTPRPHEPS